MRNWTITGLIILALYLVGNWLHDQNTKAEHALCALRADVSARAKDDQHSIDNSLKYLSDVRSGRRSPIKGITSGDILRGVQDKRNTLESRMNTIKALSILDCKG